MSVGRLTRMLSSYPSGYDASIRAVDVCTVVGSTNAP